MSQMIRQLSFSPPRYITGHVVGGNDYVSSFDGDRGWGSFSLSHKKHFEGWKRQEN